MKVEYRWDKWTRLPCHVKPSEPVFMHLAPAKEHEQDKIEAQSVSSSHHGE